MNHSEVDAIIIASPDQLHVAHLKLAIASGKPTLCEKPIATTIEDARAIAEEITEYEERNKRTIINFGFMRRFDPAYRKVKELIERDVFEVLPDIKNIWEYQTFFISYKTKYINKRCK